MGHMSSLHLVNSDCGGLSKEINRVQCRWQQRTHKTHTFTPRVRRACCVIASPSVEEKEQQQQKNKLVRSLLSFGTNVHLHPALVISSTSWLMAPPVMEARITQYIQYITSAHSCRWKLRPRWCGAEAKRTPGRISLSFIHIKWQDVVLFFQLCRKGMMKLLYWAPAERLSCLRLSFAPGLKCRNCTYEVCRHARVDYDATCVRVIRARTPRRL